MKKIALVALLVALGTAYAANIYWARADATNGNNVRTVQHTPASAVAGKIVDTSYSDVTSLPNITSTTKLSLTLRRDAVTECDSCVSPLLHTVVTRIKSPLASTWKTIAVDTFGTTGVAAVVKVKNIPNDSLSGTQLRFLSIFTDSIKFKASDTTTAKLLLRKTYVPIEYDVIEKP